MRRGIFACTLAIILLYGLPAVAIMPDFKRLLPPEATVITTESADLNGDRRPEVIIGYTLPRKGLPPTEGRAAVLERNPAGGLRRFDLLGSWPGHYPPTLLGARSASSAEPGIPMLYTPREIQLVPVSIQQPLKLYLQANPELDAFVTVWPPEWVNAIRVRGITPEGWPELQFSPHLEGPVVCIPSGYLARMIKAR